jgi:hypothetical protein
MVLVWNCCCPKMVVSQASVSGCSSKKAACTNCSQSLDNTDATG